MRIKEKTKAICVRLSDEEHSRLSKKAKAAGISISELLRNSAIRLRVYNHHQKQQWFAILLSVRKQLSALSERAQGFSPVEEVVTAAYLAAIARQLQQFETQEPEYARQDIS